MTDHFFTVGCDGDPGSDAYWDPPALGIAVVALALCAFCAAILPALRAAATSPTNALRAD